ncbi:MAG TPA: cytochrome c [Rhizomicrobium sp.]|jgi:mono/diheme cytochrome c family protein
MSAPGRTHSPWYWAGPAIIAILLVLAVTTLISWLWSASHQPKIVEPPPAPLALLTRPIPNGPNAALLQRGRYLVIAGDCVSCHTRNGGRPFNGGLGLNTPFGTIYSPDITGDKQTGVGGWSDDAFFRALNQGLAADGTHLYPAFPFPHFTIVNRADADAILAYLKTVPGQAYTPPPNALPFPLNLRLSAAGWHTLFFHAHAFQSQPQRSASWNRGAYLVEGLSHCGACHTPKNVFGAEEHSQAFRGAKLDNWFAPDLTENARTGLGRWSAADIVEFLKTGRNEHTDAAGSMAEVVAYSTSQMSDSDLEAIAAYLKSMPASPSGNPNAPDAKAMQAGASVYFDSCTACHHDRGQGSPRLFPPLAGSSVAQQNDPTTIIHFILTGGRAAPTPTRPSTPSMPSFAWKLTDQEIADVATYVRNSWGNKASPVTASGVARLRKSLSQRKTLNQNGHSA